MVPLVTGDTEALLSQTADDDVIPTPPSAKGVKLAPEEREDDADRSGEGYDWAKLPPNDKRR
jgi:hypothetical protein